LGVVRAGRDNRALLVYADSFGSTAYFPRIDELPGAFRPGVSGPAHLNPDDLSSHPSGLVESRLLHIGSRPEYTRPHGLGQIYTCTVAGSDPPTRLVISFGSKQRLNATEIAGVESIGAQVADLCERKESEREELERLRRLEGVDRLLPVLFK